MPELPIEEVFADEGDEAESHGRPQHVEDARHVVDVQLATHDLVLLIVADACEPQSFQLLHLPWGPCWKDGREGEKWVLGKEENMRERERDIKKTKREVSNFINIVKLIKLFNKWLMKTQCGHQR